MGKVDPRVWLEKNIRLALAVMALFSFVGGVAADIIPMPAKAADLDKLANSVQQMHDSYKSDSKNHTIKHLQDQIATVKLQFMVAGKTISPEAQFYLEQKQLEIQRIKESK